MKVSELDFALGDRAKDCKGQQPDGKHVNATLPLARRVEEGSAPHFGSPW